MRDPTVQLWAQDEVHFQRHTSLTRMWSAVGQQPRIASDSTRQKVGLFGAVNLKQGCLLTQMAPVFNAQSFGDFLCSLLQQTTGKIFLILDNARYHRARDLKEFFTNNKDRLIRVFLPPYSPELNPIERVWRITRRQITHNCYFESVQKLQTALTNHFEKWKTPSHTLKVLCAKI